MLILLKLSKLNIPLSPHIFFENYLFVLFVVVLAACIPNCKKLTRDGNGSKTYQRTFFQKKMYYKS